MPTRGAVMHLPAGAGAAAGDTAAAGAGTGAAAGMGAAGPPLPSSREKSLVESFRVVAVLASKRAISSKIS